MDPFVSLVKPMDFFSEKCISMLKITYIDVDCITRDTSYAHMWFPEYLKMTDM
jgi:hypothetical protein